MEKNSPKFPMIFKCELCNYKCSHKGDLKKHFNTQKHKMITLDNKKSPMDKSFICECGKTYKYASGLSKHKKKCNFNINIEESIVEKDTELNADLVLKILEENKELRKMMKEEQEKHHKEISDLIPRVGNNNNNQFNLNFFLNEQCKEYQLG